MFYFGTSEENKPNKECDQDDRGNRPSRICQGKRNTNDNGRNSDKEDIFTFSVEIEVKLSDDIDGEKEKTV